jgi:hypothetical protein
MSRPAQISLIFPRQEIAWRIMFDQDGDYQTEKPENQHDWLKIAGVSFDLLTNHRTSFMLGARWWPEANAYQMGPYCHVENGTIIKPEHTYIETVKKGQEFIFKLIFKMDSVVVQLENIGGALINNAEIGTTRVKKTLIWREISAYFGGDEKAKNPWSVWKCRLR